MMLVRYAVLVVLGFASVGIACGQEHSPVNTDKESAITALDRYEPTSQHTLATLTRRAELFEAKAQLATQCAKGLRLVEKTVNASSPEEDTKEDAQWVHDTSFLLRMWFTKEQQDEWYFTGKEYAAYATTYADEVHTKAEAWETYRKVFGLIMNAQVAVLEKLSDDLDARMNRMKELRNSH